MFPRSPVLNHPDYLINVLYKILTAVEKNSKKNAMAVLMNMVNWSQAFDKQSHFWG